MTTQQHRTGLSPEAKIGILVLSVLILLGWLSFKAGGFAWQPQGYEMKVVFQDIDGVGVHAPVTVNGFEVGRVKHIAIDTHDTGSVVLTLWIDAQVRLHQGARARIKTMGFMGEKYVALTTGDVSAPFLEPGSVIQGSPTADLQEIIVKGKALADELTQISRNINERLEVNGKTIDEMVSDLRSLVAHLDSISKNVHERLENNDEKIDRMMDHLMQTSQNLEEMTEDLKAHPWKLLFRPR